MQVKEIQAKASIAMTYPVMLQLRPHLTKEEYVDRVCKQQSMGYRLVGLFDKDNLVGLAGFQMQEMLSRGKFMYVADLVVDEECLRVVMGKVF